MPLAPITPPDRVDPNAEYRFTYCQDQLVLLLMQRTLDAITAHGTNGLATEATLAAIKAQTDQMVFTANKLRTTGEDASGGGGTSTFGDNANTLTVALTDVSAAVLAADTDRKEVIYYNDSVNDMWIFFGTPAVFGSGVYLAKKQHFTSNHYRGQVTAIMDTGKSGNLQVTEVVL